MSKKAKKGPNIPYAWVWKGKPAKKHANGDNMMASTNRGHRRTRGGGLPGRGHLSMTVPPGIPTRRRQPGGPNIHSDPGPGFWSGENLNRQLHPGQDLQYRPSRIHYAPGPLPPGQRYSPHAPFLPPPMDDYPIMTTRPDHDPRDAHPPPRHRPLDRIRRMQSHHPQNNRRRPQPEPEFHSRGRRTPSFMFDHDGDDDFFDDNDSIYSDFGDSDSESNSCCDPFRRNRFHMNPFRCGQPRRRHRQPASLSTDSLLISPSSDEIDDDSDLIFNRGNRGRGHHARGRLPRRYGYDPGFSGVRATSSESRRNWFYPDRR